MSVNRFLYATNFVVNAPANRPAGPLVNVLGQNNNNEIFKITLSGPSGPDAFLLNGDLTCSGSILNAKYATSALLNTPALDLTGSTTVNVKGHTVTLSGPATNFSGLTFNGQYATSALLNTPALDLTGSDTVNVKGQNVYVSGPTTQFKGSLFSGEYATTQFLGTDFTSRYNNAELTGYTQVHLNGQNVYVSGPTTQFKGSLFSGEYVDLNLTGSQVATLKGQIVNVSGPNTNFTGQNCNSVYNTFAGQYATSAFLNTADLDLTGSTTIDLKGHTVTLSGPVTNFSGDTLTANYGKIELLKQSAERTVVTVDNNGMVVDGMLVVKGDMVTRTSQQVLLGDSHIGLNAQHRLNNEMGGGMTVVNKALSSFEAASMTVNKDGGGATISSNIILRNSKYGVNGVVVLKTGDIMQISESSHDDSNGYYILESVSGAAEVVTVSGAVYSLVIPDNTNTSVVFTFKNDDLDLPNEIFLRQSQLVADLTSTFHISHVLLSDLRIDGKGDIFKAHGSDSSAFSDYYSVGGSSYENVKANGQDIEHTISKKVTVCEASANVVNLKLPEITTVLKGEEYKVINKQSVLMKVTVDKATTHINGYTQATDGGAYVNIIPSTEDRSIVFIATMTSDNVTGWQMV